jgi:ABC-type multidrug transport system ATPase subunit
MVSWRHARLVRRDGSTWLEDLGSTNATLVNGRPVERHELADGDRILVGNTSLLFSGGTLHPDVETGFRVDRASLALKNGRRIVDDVSFSMAEPSLVAVIGPSGAGKSSLLRLVTGQIEPSSGAVSLHHATMTSQRRAHRGQIGVVPQYTVAHTSLTARRALDYTARLRLPPDVGGAERRRRVEAVLEQLGLAEHADTRMARLSGGQQRRVGIAMEMLTDPSMLILDEPTAGLDPSLVLQIMRVLRGLADSGKHVLLVTHDLEHLVDLVDRVVVLRPGGTVAFFGPPDQVFTHFGTSTWAETFDVLTRAEERRPRRSGSVVAPPADLPAVRAGFSGALRSASVVMRRQLRLIASDPPYLALLLGMPLVLGVLALAVPGASGLGATRDQTSVEAVRLLVLLIVGAAFLGLSSSVRDLVGERSIFQHERDAGLAPLGYLSAKVTVFFALAGIQASLLVAIVVAARAGPRDALVLGSPTMELGCAVVGTALTGVALGLAISSRVATTEQSMPPLVILVMGQLVMCGGLFPVDGRGVLPVLSWVFPTRWGYAAAAATVDLNRLSAAVEPDDLWAHDVSNWWGCMVLLAVVGAAALVVAALGVLRRQRFP